MKKDIEPEENTEPSTEELINAFSYKHINDAAKHDIEIYLGNFFAAKNHQEGSHDYIDFMCIGIDNPNAELSDLEYIYITIDDTNSTNMENAWNSILPVLIKYQVYGVRVVGEGSNYAHNITLPKCSQQIVLRRYCDFDTSATRWNQILTEITQALINAKVEPGPINMTGGYEILGSFCLRRKTPIDTELEGLASINMPNQPNRKIVSRQRFNNAVTSLNPRTRFPKGDKIDYRKKMFLLVNTEKKPSTDSQQDKNLLDSSEPNNDDDDRNDSSLSTTS